MKSPSSAAPWPDEADDRLASAILGKAEVALFENAYAAYSAEARHTALAFLGDPQLALDAVHNAYLEILRHLLSGNRWSDPTEARGVVLRNTRWAALKMLRTRRRHPEQSIEGSVARTGGEDAAWAHWEARALCEQIVAQLRPQQQQALHLHFTEGLSNPEAAERLGITPSGYAAQLQRAITAARRAARSSGLLPGVIWVPVGAVKTLSSMARRHARAARTLAAVTAKAGAVAGIAVLAVQGVGVVTRATPSRPTTVQMSGASLPMPAVIYSRLSAADETMADITVVDAIAVHADNNPEIVMALGRGARCQCWVVARSTDAGGRWMVSDAPGSLSPAARLSVAAGYPVDPRIVITEPGAPGVTAWVSPRFLAAFEKLRAPIHVAEAARLEPCRQDASGTICLGQRIATPTTADGPGKALRVGDHLLYVPSLGGALCSADGGRSWRTACASTA